MTRTLHRTRGFSFTELMFAVIVLGIGFILVAAIFPVAISQSQSTVDDTVGSGFARSAASLLNNVSSNPTITILPVTDGRLNIAQMTRSDRLYPLTASLPALPPIGITAGQTRRFGYMVPILGPVGTLNAPPVAFNEAVRILGNNTLSTADNRYAWTALYRRDLLITNNNLTDVTYVENALPTGVTATIAPFAQVTIIGLRTRNTDAFNNTQMTENNFRPTIAAFKLTEGQRVGQPDLIWFTQDNGAQTTATPYSPDAATPGAYLVIGDDRQGDNLRNGADPSDDLLNAGKLNGKVMQLGVQRLDLDPNGSCFELATGNDLNLVITTQATPANDVNEQLPARVTPDDFNTWKAFPAGGAAFGWLIGAGYENPNIAPSGTNRASGAARDIAVYTTFVPVTP